MIPLNEELSIIPSNIINKIESFFKNKFKDIECDQDIVRKKYNLYCFNDIKKEIFNLIKTKSFWKNSMNLKHCDHMYKSGKKIKTFCNKIIDITYEKHRTKDNGSYKCYKHVSKTIYRSIKRDALDKSRFCIDINNRNKNCRNYKLYGNYCCSHYTRYKEYMDIIKNNDNYNLYYDINIELNILYNIYTDIPKKVDAYNDVDNFKKVNENVDFMLHNNSCNQDPKMGTEQCFEIREMGEINNNSNIIKIAKNAKNLEKLENNFISNYIRNTNNKLHELNRKIIENTSIIEKLKNNYTKIEYKKCEYKGCTNCKKYNIIYSTYCTDHISHRPPPITNFFHMYTPAAIDHKFMTKIKQLQ